MFGKSKKQVRQALLAGRDVGTDINLAVGFDGMIMTVSLDDEKLLECTYNDAMFVMLGIARVLGKKTSKALIDLQPDGGWEHKAGQ